MLNKIRNTEPFASPIFIRIAVGCIFLSEGIQKFLFAAQRGSGRFEKLGIPEHEFFGPFVGATEIFCAILILAGWYTRLAAIPLIIIMVVALITTKIVNLPVEGFWEIAHGARTDFSMLLSGIFLLVAGAGRWSIDFNVHSSKYGKAHL